MRDWRCAFIALLLAGFHAEPALAERVAPSVHVGTLGLGARVTTSLGGSVYMPAEVRTIRGSLGTSRFAPYLDLGCGDLPGAGFSFALDFGAAVDGTPEFNYGATGPVSNDPRFESDLQEEAELVNDDLSGVASVDPTLNLGFSFRL